MKTLACFLVLTLLTQTGYSTVVVLLRTDKQIIVGADSRRTVLGKDFKDHHTVDDWCKIRQAGTFYFTLGGENDKLQIGHANHAATIAKSVDEFASIFGRTLSGDYNLFLTDMKSINPAQFKSHNFKNNKFAEVAIFRLENGVPQLYIVRFYNKNNIDEPVNVGFTVEVNPAIMFLGYTNEIIAMPAQERVVIQSYQQSNPFLFVEKIIRYEQKFYPKIIGGPIHMLTLQAGKEPVWHDKKPTC